MTPGVNVAPYQDVLCVEFCYCVCCFVYVRLDFLVPLEIDRQHSEAELTHLKQDSGDILGHKLRVMNDSQAAPENHDRCLDWFLAVKAALDDLRAGVLFHHTCSSYIGLLNKCY